MVGTRSAGKHRICNIFYFIKTVFNHNTIAKVAFSISFMIVIIINIY